MNAENISVEMYNWWGHLETRSGLTMEEAEVFIEGHKEKSKPPLTYHIKELDSFGVYKTRCSVATSGDVIQHWW